MTDPIRVERPCDRRWSDLDGDGVRRACDDCGKHVFDLHALTDAEIEAKRAAGGFCGSYVAGADGVFRRPPGAGRSTLAAAAAAMLALLGACGQATPPGATPPPDVAGDDADDSGVAVVEQASALCPDCGGDHGAGPYATVDGRECILITGYIR